MLLLPTSGPLGAWPVLRDVYWKIGTLLAWCVGLSQVTLWSHPPAHLPHRTMGVHVRVCSFPSFVQVSGCFSIHLFLHLPAIVWSLQRQITQVIRWSDRWFSRWSHRWLGCQTGDHTGNLVARQVIESQICRLGQEPPQVFAVIWCTCQQKFRSKGVEVMRKIFISRATEHRVIRHKSAANDRWEVWAQHLLNDATELHHGQKRQQQSQW